MALVGTHIESRTIAGLTSGQSTSYAHSMGVNPDYAIVQYIATLATSNTIALISIQHDASNVTVRNNGNATSPDMRVVAFRIHALLM